MSKTAWTREGKLLVDDLGRVIVCEECPCDSYPFVAAASECNQCVRIPTVMKYTVEMYDYSPALLDSGECVMTWNSTLWRYEGTITLNGNTYYPVIWITPSAGVHPDPEYATWGSYGKCINEIVYCDNTYTGVSNSATSDDSIPASGTHDYSGCGHGGGTWNWTFEEP